MNTLYYGDNLTVLRNEVDDESIDLIYLDPPFNSKASYNVLFRSTSGEKSQAQIEAFEDTFVQRSFGRSGIVGLARVLLNLMPSASIRLDQTRGVFCLHLACSRAS